MLRYFLAWFPLLAIAVANGALRQGTYGKAMSELHAHQLSTLIGMVAIGALIRLIVRRWPPTSNRQAVGIGVVWLALTVAFEFLMGLLLASRPLTEVLADYNVLKGRVWIVFLIWLTFAPLFFYRLGLRSRRAMHGG